MSELCRACRLCCDGSMFHATDLGEADDRAPLVANGAVIVVDVHSTRFEQPCPALAREGCTIYEQRPAMCRAYDCAVLHGVASGDLSIDDARAIVDTAATLRDSIHERLDALEAHGPRVLGSRHLASRIARAHRRLGGAPELERVVDDALELQAMIAAHFTVNGDGP